MVAAVTDREEIAHGPLCQLKLVADGECQACVWLHATLIHVVVNLQELAHGGQLLRR